MKQGVSSQLPEESELGQNYRNPFNLEAIIEFFIAYPTQVKVEIGNI